MSPLLQAVSKKGSGKQKKKFVTLAIGDGANDVKMIKSVSSHLFFFVSLPLWNSTPQHFVSWRWF